jgi:hypothetical protein
MKTGMATESVGASISDIGAMVGVGTESHAGGWHDIVSRVEVVSKVAESAVASLRKLQQPQ